jgi:DNA invertase Pin-like site-specific DNA recombinase
MKAIGYARVSTKDQKLDVQIEQIKRYCEYRNIDLVRLYTDKASGANTDRPEFQEMLTDIETNAHGADVIIVWKLDRIGRSLKNLIEIVELFKAKELGFVCINANIDTTTNEGRLFFHIFASFAEYERALINERTTLGREAALEKGVKFGRPIVEVNVSEVRRRIADGVPKTKVARDMGISRSTLHRRLNPPKEA